MYVNVQPRFLLVTSRDTTAAIRIDRILSLTYSELQSVLTIRFMDEPKPECYEGPLAEAIIRELRNASVS